MEKIAVLGLGKVGTLAAELLHDSGFTVTGIDIASWRAHCAASRCLTWATSWPGLWSPCTWAVMLTVQSQRSACRGCSQSWDTLL